MAAGWFSGPFRWLLGRMGKPQSGPVSNGALCFAVAASPTLAFAAGCSSALTFAVSAEVC